MPADIIRRGKRLFGTTAPQEEMRAVSPVIGVILMVAITVILAAVVGTFVLDMGSKIGKSAPSVALSVSDYTDDYDPNSTITAFELTHKGGPGLLANEIAIRIRWASNNSMVFELNHSDGGFKTSNGGANATLNALGGGKSNRIFSEGDVYSTGDALFINADTRWDDPGELRAGEPYLVRVVHRPTGDLIFATEVRLR